MACGKIEKGIWDMRHPEYRYECGKSRKTGGEYWTDIVDKDNSGWGESVFDMWDDSNEDGPVEFIQRIKEENGWTVIDLGMGRYSFAEDKSKMVFQWDDLFGFVIVVDSEKKLKLVKEVVCRYGA